MSPATLTVPQNLRRGAKRDEKIQIDQGVELLEVVRDVLNVSSLADVALLDMGCGTKIAQAIINREIPIRRYVGVDVYTEMIAYLRKKVRDPRFSFHAVDFQNDMYNPGGRPMNPAIPLPVGQQTFDAIAAFSVFTHLAPMDYRALLGMLRHHAHDSTRLIFTLFIGANQAEPFLDAFPNKPLRWAYYREDRARALIDGTGWQAIALHAPRPAMQHCFVCRPV
jgi:predicted TPR repeat methyltransferase